MSHETKYSVRQYGADRPASANYRNAVWEHQVKRRAFKGWRWLIIGPVAGIFAVVAIVLIAG